MKILQALLLLLALCAQLEAQNNRVRWYAFDGGFARGTSNGSVVKSVAGQAVVGIARALANQVETGFWRGVAFERSGSAAGIVYGRSGPSGPTVWITSGDGISDVQVSAGEYPRASHNGRYILLHQGTNPNWYYNDLHLLDLQTGRDTILYHNPNWMNDCGWTSNDSAFAFDLNCDIEMMNRDGTGNRVLLNVDCRDDEPVWRPGSSAIAFHNDTQGILLTDSLGVNRHQIPNTVPFDLQPVWSPDGQWIGFGHAVQAGTRIANFYKIHPDGSGLTALTAYPGTTGRFNLGSAWTEDGTKLIVSGSVNGVNGIYAIDAGGSHAMGRITTLPGDSIKFVGSIIGNVNVTLTSVPEQQEQLPAHYQLEQNHPNPFNPSTTIAYEISSSAHVAVRVYDILGREVVTLIDGVQNPGSYRVTLDASHMVSGVYFYRLEAGSFVSVKKMLLLK